MPGLDLTWVLCDQAGAPLPGGHLATNRRLVAGRNQSMEARLTLNLRDEAARQVFAVLPNGLPQLRVYLGSLIVFSGYWTPMKGAGSVDGASTVDLVFRDAFSRLYQRNTAAIQNYTAMDAGLIAESLILSAKLLSSTGIDADPSYVTPTMVRDRSYSYKNVGDAVTELTQVLQGFDWFPVYQDPRPTSAGIYTMQFHVVQAVGTDQPTAIFEYGQGTLENCQSYSFTSSLPINHALAFGAGTPPLVVEAFDLDSRRLYGTTQAIISATDVVETQTLSDKANDALRLSPVFVTEFKPDPAKAPLPWLDFWIGDTVRWNVSDGAFQQQLTPRVETIEVAQDDSDNISEIVIGIDPAAGGAFQPPANSTRAYVQSQRDMLRRLSALERA